MYAALRRNDCPERIIKHLRGDADNSTADRYDHVTWEEVVDSYTACIPALLLIDLHRIAIEIE